MSTTSAVLDVVVENKEISSILKDNKEYDAASLCSYSNENSLVQSPSIESFSTIHDTETLSELNMDEDSDLCVKVDSPQKHLETLETYITFQITTKVARIEFTENKYVVRRRYNDFLWLRQRLVEKHPFCIVPPLPGKHTLMGQLDRYSKEFIVMRMRALNVFLSRIVQHPILSCNECFYVFLTANQVEFIEYRKRRYANGSESKAKLPTAPATNLAKKGLNEFDKTKHYLTSLSEKLASIERISNRINRERSEFVVELKSFHPVFTTWATGEPELAELLQNIGHAVERSTAAENNLVSKYNTSIGSSVKDFLAYIEVVQELLRKREVYQNVFEVSMDELNKKHSEKDRLVASAQQNPQPSSSTLGFSLWKQPSCEEKIEKLDSAIPELQNKVDITQDSLECANESLRSDLTRWKNEKEQCLKKLLLDFVNKQIEYEKAKANAWEEVVNSLPCKNMATK